MGQRIFALALAALLGLTAAGCGTGPRQEPKPPEELTDPAEVLPPAEETTDPAGETADPADLLETESLDGLRYGQTEAEVESLWGAPGEKTEPEVWASDGLSHSQWRYDGAELSFADGTLETVRVTAPLPGKTAAGVGLGSTAEEVRGAYPELIDEESSTEELLVAGSVYGGLLFILEDGAVTRVVLGASGE